MILITTAGKVGAEAVALLAERGEPVRVLVRDPERVTAVRRDGVDVVQGDLSDAESIDRAMDGVTGIVLVSPAVPEQELNVITSAVRAGVGHLVKITSTASADSPIARQRDQATIEAGLVSSGLPHTLLRNNFYMQNFLMLAPEIAATGGFSASAGSGQAGFIDTRDVAAVAAEIAAAPAEHVNATYLLTGPALLSYADVAAALSTALARPIAFHERTREADARAMIEAGVPAAVAEMNAHAVSLIAVGDAAWLSVDVARLLGRPPRTFAQFAADHADAFTEGRS